MKITKPSETKVKDTIALAGGVVAGSMLSRAAFGLVHEATTATDAASIQKDENTALLKRGGLVLVGLAGAMFIDGKDSLTTAAKGVAAGVATEQILAAIKVLAGRQGVTATADSSTGRKALANAVGLGCPCNERVPLASPVTFAPRYSHSNMDYMETETAALNGWGGSDEPGLAASWADVQLSA